MLPEYFVCFCFENCSRNTFLFFRFENSVVGILFICSFLLRIVLSKYWAFFGEHCYGNTGCFVVENCVVGILYL